MDQLVYVYYDVIYCLGMFIEQNWPTLQIKLLSQVETTL